MLTIIRTCLNGLMNIGPGWLTSSKFHLCCLTKQTKEHNLMCFNELVHRKTLNMFQKITLQNKFKQSYVLLLTNSLYSIVMICSVSLLHLFKNRGTRSDWLESLFFFCFGSGRRTTLIDQNDNVVSKVCKSQNFKELEIFNISSWPLL